MEHPPVDHWVVPGIRAAVKCDGCGRVFEVWAGELWYYHKLLNIIIIKPIKRLIN